MPVFKLRKDTIARLEKEFLRFHQARKIIHENIVNYVADYRQFKGTPRDRKEFLEREYFPRTPDLNSLIFDDEKNFLWHVEDIVILTGLSQPSISRILTKMQRSPSWFPRLLPLQIEVKSANNNSIYAYREEIFDLIIDYQEEKCLERFIAPRRGKIPDAQEILRYWEYLKIKNENDEFAIISEKEELNEVPDIPVMRVRDILMLMFKKIFTAKNLTISTAIFAVCFEAARRFNFLIPVFAGFSILIFVASVLLLKFRHGKASLISEVGAIAMLSFFIWGLGIFSDGVIYMPSGMALTLNDDHAITLVPQLEEGRRVTFEILSDFYDDMKEIYYRTSAKEKFKLTGFNHVHYPVLFIEPETQHGTLNIELKYKDTKNKEHGPFKFSFDMDKTRFEASKEFIFSQTHWLIVREAWGKIGVIINIDTWDYTDDVVSSVVYGINKETPDKEIKITPERSRVELDISKIKNFEYISAYLVFKDGTRSKILTERSD